MQNPGRLHANSRLGLRPSRLWAVLLVGVIDVVVYSTWEGVSIKRIRVT